MRILPLAVTALLALAPTALAQENASPWSLAEQYYDPAEMRASRQAVQKANGDQKHSLFMADRIELQSTNGEDILLWDAQAWYGTDENKLWIKTEGEFSFASDTIEDAEIQALWSHAISTYFDLQAGLRYDLDPKGRTHGVIGVQGLAPYWFEIDAATFISTDGDITARVEAEYDMRFTQRLILQPRLELEFSAQDIPTLDLGTGFTSFDAGLRLRYEVTREFSPYIGVEWQRALRSTADIVRANGEDASKTAFVIGIRAWY
ncbi:MAG: copper resistance protein CopB [Robiginitomaculum sp.]|nr:MAG: copper resistance protein CopB [Robiginitomaculum sp.]